MGVNKYNAIIYPKELKKAKAQDMLYKACNIASLGLFNKAIRLGADPNHYAEYALWRAIENCAGGVNADFVVQILPHFKITLEEDSEYDFHRMENAMLSLEMNRDVIFAKIRECLGQSEIDEIAQDFFSFLTKRLTEREAYEFLITEKEGIERVLKRKLRIPKWMQKQLEWGLNE
jgi:hypothetical protein